MRRYSDTRSRVSSHSAQLCFAMRSGYNVRRRVCTGVRPLAVSEWRSLLESEGLEVQSVDLAPMSLLEPRRLIRDEGLAGALRFVWNPIRDSEARARVLEMRSVFRRHRHLLGAVAITV